MSGNKSFATGGAISILGIAGLFMAAHAHDPLTYGAGLTFAGIAVAIDFWLLKRWFDRTDIID